MPLYFQAPERYLTPEQRGWIAESVTMNSAVSSTILPTAGLLMAVRITVPRASSVTNVIISVATAGGTLTSGQCFAALYQANALVGVTATQHTAWESTGLKTMALASGPFAVTAGYVYAAVWANGTTLPTFHRGVSIAAATLNSGFATPNLVVCSADGSLTTTAPPTMAAQTGTGAYWYAAIS